MRARALAGGMRASVQGSCKLLVVVQLTNAGLEICWTRAARMHWRAGAAKERPASILRDVLWVGEGMGGGGGVAGVDLQAAKAAIPKAKDWRLRPASVRRQSAEAHRRDTDSRLPRPSRFRPTELRAFLLRLPISKCFASVDGLLWERRL